jgi:hypothetical protein
MSNVLASIKNVAIISRFEQVALETALVVDKTIHAAGETLERGTLLGKLASGKHRAYAEGTVKAGGAFSNAAATFTLDVAVSPIAKHLRVGDVIESVGGTALGTIATYDKVTGVGTLTGNSANNLAAGQKVRIAIATVVLANSKAKVLKNDIECSSDFDAVGVGYFEGVFVKDATTITDAAIAAVSSWGEPETNEVRIK